MNTLHLVDPLTADPETLAELDATLLSIRIRNTSCRLALALARARGFAETWGMAEQAATWDWNARALARELAALTDAIDDAETFAPCNEQAA